ncbi:PREDICTED: uncharacterized protein LOC109588689 [Amphimedon queenslandica]|nr:PREDICTED: uncharacterized protein LOC109588689 [Amphimedon queenslandica]|eukprot:XP_019860382.1 PREDICTED: uncharacterized protein LOC109588689 [Amphimedon queenslandica]
MLNNGDIDKIIHKEVERKVDQIETFYEAQCESTKYRFIHMLWNLDVFIEGLSKKSPQENGGYKLCVRKKSDQEQTDCGESTLAVDLDLHIEKLLYEKSLAQPDLKKWVPLVTLVDLLKRMKESKELLTKYGILEGDIQSCIYSYDKIFVKDHSQNPKCRCYGLTKDTAIDIEMDELDRTVSCSTSPLQRLAPRPFGDDDNAIVSGFLLMLHLLFTKYVFISVRSQRPANESTERNDDPNENLSKNFNKFFKDNCLNWCNILSRLIANENCKISYMSASLLFDICMKEQIIDKNKPIFANYKENVVPMKSEELELIKKMLLMQLNEKDREDLIKFLTGFYSQDKSKPNVAVNNLKFVYNSGLFHIILEYTLKHNTYSIFYKQEVISCCFELLQGLAASSEKVRNEMFRYFLNFLQFKRVTNVMICLINEIFYGNSYLSKKLTKSDLGKIFYTAIMNGTADGHYQWTIVLQTIIENSDQVQVQEHVAQLISKHSNDYLQHILCPREQREVNWLDILKSNEEHKDECHLLLNITDLLASCASGECQYGRLVAMKLIFFDDLME